MKSIKSTSERRSSLLPPRINGASPNAPMVLASNVPITVTKHNRQRDQQTESHKERNDQLNQQRHSLAQAIDVINSWKQKDSTNPSNNTDQYKRNNESQNDVKNSELIKSQSVNLPLDRTKNTSMTNYFYKTSKNL